MRAADFDDAMKDFPKYYDSILEGAMLKLEKTLECAAYHPPRLRSARDSPGRAAHSTERPGHAGHPTSLLLLLLADAPARGVVPAAYLPGTTRRSRTRWSSRRRGRS